MTLEADDNRLFIVGDVTRFCPDLVPFIISQRLVQLVCALLDTSEIVTHFANLTMKSAHVGSGISWHRDYPNKFICPVAPSMVRTMICVDGMTAQTGATLFLPGSQDTPHLAAASVDFLATRVETTICPPGAIVAIHPLVLHGGQPNFSSTPRRNIIIQWGRKDVPLSGTYTESVTGKTVAELRVFDSTVISNRDVLRSTR